MNNLRLMGLLRKKTSHGHKVSRNYRKSIKISYSSDETLKSNVHTVVGKAMIDGAANKRRTIIAKSLNFKDKQEVLSEYKARKFWTKGIFINEDFLKILWRNAKISSKELRCYKKKGS